MSQPNTLEIVTQTYLAPKEPNPQLFKNNDGLVNEYVQLQADGKGLHGQRPPNFAIVHQKPEHYVIVFLKAKGHNNREIAAKTGYTEPWVSQIVRQPWFIVELRKELKEAGQTAIMGVLEATCEDSIAKLVTLRDCAKSEAVQLAATINLIDRFLGKPVQQADIVVSKKQDAVKHHESLQDELKELERQEKELKDKLLKIHAA